VWSKNPQGFLIVKNQTLQNINKTFLPKTLMKKKGQFYLLSAIIIISIISGFFAVKNYSDNSENVKIFDLKEELGIESEQVLDYGIYNRENMENLLGNFTKIYSTYAGSEKEIYFIFGNTDGVYIASYRDVETGSVSITIPETSFTLTINEKDYKKEKLGTVANGNIDVKIKDTTYNFKLNPGENFYFIIAQEIKGNQYVVKK